MVDEPLDAPSAASHRHRRPFWIPLTAAALFTMGGAGGAWLANAPMNGRHVSLPEQTRILRPCRLRGTRCLYTGGRTRAPQASGLLRPSTEPIHARLRLRPRRRFHRTRMQVGSLTRPTRPCTARDRSIASLSSGGPFIAIDGQPDCCRTNCEQEHRSRSAASHADTRERGEPGRDAAGITDRRVRAARATVATPPSPPGVSTLPRSSPAGPTKSSRSLPRFIDTPPLITTRR